MSEHMERSAFKAGQRRYGLAKKSSQGNKKWIEDLFPPDYPI